MHGQVADEEGVRLQVLFEGVAEGLIGLSPAFMMIYKPNVDLSRVKSHDRLGTNTFTCLGLECIDFV